jgi:hypothetical protein
MTRDELRAFHRYTQRSPIWRSARIQRDLPRMFADLEAHYLKDKNPRHVWGAYSLARRARAPIPNFVLVYFDRVAESMFVLNMHPPTERQIAGAAAEALELPRGGRRNAFREWPDQNHQEDIAGHVQDLIDEGHKLSEAARQVGSEHPTSICRALFPQCKKPLSRATVESYYKRFARKA